MAGSAETGSHFRGTHSSLREDSIPDCDGDTYIHTYVSAHIMRVDPSFRASCSVIIADEVIELKMVLLI